MHGWYAHEMRCAACGHEGDWQEGAPCPQCGGPSVRVATVSARAMAGAAPFSTVTGSVTRWQQRILEAARRICSDVLADGPTFAAVIVIAQTACEVAAERAVTFLIQEKHPGGFGEASQQYVRKYVFHNDERLQALWTSLTNDQIQQHASFWPSYTAHVERRNRAAHNGLNKDGTQFTKEQAEASLAAAESFLDHIKSVLVANGLAKYA